MNTEQLEAKEEARRECIERERRCDLLEKFVGKLKGDLQENLMRDWADEDVNRVDGICLLSQMILDEISKLERRL